MDEHGVREVLRDVEAGRVSRRRFVESMMALGLSAPVAKQMLSAKVAVAQPATTGPLPTRRGGGGPLKLLYWQAPTIQNPHLATGLKDAHAARVFYEQLANFDSDGNLVPILAADIPSLQNGGVAANGLSATWNLRKSVTWHDGRPFPPTTWCSRGSTQQIRLRPRPPWESSKNLSGSRSSAITPCDSCSRSRRHSGRSLPSARCYRDTCFSPIAATRRVRRPRT